MIKGRKKPSAVSPDPDDSAESTVKERMGTLTQAIRKNERDISNLKAAVVERDIKIERIKQELNNAIGELVRVKRSKSFLTGYYLVHPKALARDTAHTARVTAKRQIVKIKDLPAATKAQMVYASKDFLDRPVVRDQNTSTAVILHLYFSETWPEFSSRLQALTKHSFDLFITLPKQNASFAKTILDDYPNAYILKVPNRGRDVLPFMQVAPLLLLHGYEYVLKLHSKKSVHRNDGNDWLSGMLNSLVPSDPPLLRQLFETLSNKSTGVVGPQGQYVSLSVNFKENHHYISKLLKKIRSLRISDQVSRDRTSYGFFAGTMFWARLDALRPILEQGFTAIDFDAERGQIDATFAHALERVFCLIPELDSKTMYEVGESGLRLIDYKTDNIPDWSDVYIGPKT